MISVLRWHQGRAGFMFALGTLLSLAGPLHAQKVVIYPVTGAWVDSLQAWPDDSLSRSLNSRTDLSRPEGRLKNAWLLLRGGERFDSVPLLLRAADQFYEVTVRRSRWAEAWYGLGRSKSRLADHGTREVPSAHQPAGTGWVWGSAVALMRALELDPTWGAAAIALVKLGPRFDSPGRAQVAWNVTARALRADSTDPALWLISAAAARPAHDDAGVLRALDRALPLPDAPRGEIQIERARALYALDRPAAAESTYYDGALAADSVSTFAYRRDLTYIADSGALAAWDRLVPGERPAWLHEFWGSRERASGRPAGSRLAEHARRYRYAKEHYGAIPTWSRQFDFQMIYRDAPAEIDDRGAVYIRHGEPDQTANAIGEVLLANVSWLYFRPEGNLIFHFVAGSQVGYVSGWHLITSLNDIGSYPDGPSAEVYSSRMGLDPAYGALAMQIWQDSITRASFKQLTRFGYSPSETSDRRPYIAVRIERERRVATQQIRRGLSTDTDPLRFERNFEPIAQIFGAGGGRPGEGRLVAVLALPASDWLVPITLPDGGAGYLLRLRITSADDSGHTTLDADTVFRLRTPRALTRGEYLSMVGTFDLPATGNQRVRVILTDTARANGAVRVLNGVPVFDLAPPAIQMSDVILGSTRSGLEWRRPEGGILPLNPLNAWTTAESVEIGFEVSGLTPGTPFKVRIGIADLAADTTRPPRASVEFDQEATAVRQVVTQSLALRTLRPGSYLLTTVVSVGDRVLRRERRITVVAAK